ncbi:MAG: peptidoglycan-binding protein [Cyanobacteria bacterium J06621_11]
MKPFAIRSLGLGVAFMTLIQLPAVASSVFANKAAQSVNENTPASGLPAQPQLLAVALTTRSLGTGSQGADVRVLQRYLSREGLYPFVIDGFYGQETANAVATYQRIRDLPATGQADEETLSDMGFDFLPRAANNSIPLPPSPSQSVGSVRSGSLGPGSTGDDVVALQQRLNDLGFLVRVDGDYGFETQQAVRTYQRVQDLNDTGTADRETLRAMGLSSSGRSGEFRYVAAVLLGNDQLSTVRQYFEDAYIDVDRRGEFINVGNFDSRYPAEARVDAARARGFRTRVLYR